MDENLIGNILATLSDKEKDIHNMNTKYIMMNNLTKGPKEVDLPVTSLVKLQMIQVNKYTSKNTTFRVKHEADSSDLPEVKALIDLRNTTDSVDVITQCASLISILRDRNNTTTKLNNMYTEYELGNIRGKRCPYCRSCETYQHTVQTRSADEAAVTRYECTGCNRKFGSN